MDLISPPETPPSPAGAGDSSEIFELSYRLSHLARHHLQTRLAVYNLTPPQYAALRAIQESGGSITVSALARAAHQVTPTMTGIINRLEDRRLVIRRRARADRRRQLVSLTGLGSAILEDITRDIRRATAALLDELDPAQRDLLVNILRNLANKFTIAV